MGSPEVHEALLSATCVAVELEDASWPVSPKVLSQADSRKSVSAGGVIGQSVSLCVFTILISFAWT